MYQQYFGLRELPFDLTPNPRYLFLTHQHREALSTLVYGLSTGKGLTLLIGEVGTGKTTLLHAALQSDKCRHVMTINVTNPTLTRQEFFELLAVQLELSANATRSKAAFLTELNVLLRERRQRGQVTAIVVDEAQSLSAKLLEEIRLLANNETSTAKLLALVLAGQPELRDRLNTPELRQLKQRVTLRSELVPFSLNDTAAYIATRIRVAGGEAWRVFTREAVTVIHQRSGGIPRTINVICDNALMTGLALGKQPVDVATVMEVVRDFDLPALAFADDEEEPAALPAERPAETLAEKLVENLAETPTSEPVLGPASIELTPTPADDAPPSADAPPRRFSVLGSR
jgi:general secretion pathway protein A